MAYFAKKTTCLHGHRHDSKAEANRCAILHDRLRRGEIEALVYAPTYHFEINGHALVMRNGQRARYTADFSYLEDGNVIVEDVKASNGYMARDVPLRLALFRHLYPHVELRVVT